MNDIDTIAKIKQTLKELDEMPYGIESHGKLLPPNIHHYSQSVNRLVDYLLHLEDKDATDIAIKLRSIQNNQLSKILTSKDNSFDVNGVHEGIEYLNRQIHLYVDSLIGLESFV